MLTVVSFCFARFTKQILRFLIFNDLFELGIFTQVYLQCFCEKLLGSSGKDNVLHKQHSIHTTKQRQRFVQWFLALYNHLKISVNQAECWINAIRRVYLSKYWKEHRKITTCYRLYCGNFVLYTQRKFLVWE